MDMEREQNPRIENSPRDKTSIELPAVIFQAADIVVERTSARSRTQLIHSLIWWGINMDLTEVDRHLREYRRARISDIKPFLMVNEPSPRPKLGRPRQNPL